MSEPKQAPGRSRQDYRTPPEFLTAVKDLLGIEHFALDVCASKDNAVALTYHTVERNGLAREWDADGWNWCNPPYGDIGPWVEKAGAERVFGISSAVLIPAAVGANWWKRYVHEEACVLFLNGRITFVGCPAPFPKDCALVLYSPSWEPGYDVWTWKKPADAAWYREAKREAIRSQISVE